MSPLLLDLPKPLALYDHLAVKLLEAKGAKEIIKDLGSGMNYNKAGFNK